MCLKTCDACRGSGRSKGKTCGKCDGNKKIAGKSSHRTKVREES